MKFITGKIVAGQVIVDGAPFDEGTVVSVFTHEADEPFELSDGEEAALMLSIQEAERGEVISGAELIASLRGP
ncbi:UNVERIFIED_ORG: hypothetical protein JN05_03129 [Zoogloea ramigera]|uniref:Cold-shock protein n=1 Tax=Duganella zoogloeoides TaxID=75659 RepID=A0ABZ0Y2T9_9BURK|nr:hypothetical protein [Duganella zoogloeoides]WQH05792.1 hypothetical protein SR858_05485 [Duganella zoogloeoides]